MKNHKLLSLVLAMSLVFQLSSFSVFADETETSTSDFKKSEKNEEMRFMNPNEKPPMPPMPPAQKGEMMKNEFGSQMMQPNMQNAPKPQNNPNMQKPEFNQEFQKMKQEMQKGMNQGMKEQMPKEEFEDEEATDETSDEESTEKTTKASEQEKKKMPPMMKPKMENQQGQSSESMEKMRKEMNQDMKGRMQKDEFEDEEEISDESMDEAISEMTEMMESTSDDLSSEDFDPDMNGDGTVDDFETKVEACLEGNMKNMPKCQRKIKQEMKSSMMQGNFENMDPESFEHMMPFASKMDPSVFENVEDDSFFQKMDPNFFNRMDASKIPDNALQNMDVKKLKKIDPELLKKLQESAPEQAGMIPENVRKKAEFMMDDIPEDLLEEYGFSGDEAEKVKNLMKAVNKQKREKLAQALENVDEETRSEMMDLQDDFGDEVSGFMEYLPFVPEKSRESFMKQKKESLQNAKKLEEFGKTFDEKIQEEMNRLNEILSNYNFTGESAETVKTEIEALVTKLPTMTKEEVKAELPKIHEQLQALKEQAKQEKFAQGIIPFKDTDDDQWFTAFVSEAAQKGVIGGYKDAQGKALGEFKPGNKVTIAEAIKMAVANAGLEESSEAPTLEQAQNHWVKGWVKTAEDNNMSVDSIADINGLATRGAVVRWVIESFGITPEAATSSSFTDVEMTDTNIDYIEYAKEVGLVSGDGDTGNFRPNDTIVRAEVAKMLQKANEVFGEE